MRDECGKHGTVKRLLIPRPTPAQPNPPGVAKVRRAACSQRRPAPHCSGGASGHVKQTAVGEGAACCTLSFTPRGCCCHLSSPQVIIEYEDMGAAMRARNSMHGRKFGGRTVIGTFLPEDQYLRGAFDASS